MSESADNLAPSDAVILTLSEQIAQWEEEVRVSEMQIEAAKMQIEAATKRAEAFRQRVQLGMRLTSLIKSGDEQPIQTAPVPVAAVPPKAAAPKVRKLREGTWPKKIQEWLYASGEGLTGAQLRDLAMADDEFSSRLIESEKGFYHALSRLQKGGVIERHKGRYFSPQALQDHLRRVSEGEATDDPVSPYKHSPMGEAILDIVTANPGIRGADIVRHLRIDPEFDAALTPNTTGAYNVISRLTRRRFIHRDGQHCFPGPEMPPRTGRSKWLKADSDTNGAMT